MTRSIVYVWTEGDRHFDTFQSRQISRTGKMAASNYMAAAIPEIRDLVRYKQFLKVNMAASSSDEQSSHQNTFAS